MRISCDYQLLDTNGCIKVNGHWNLGLSSLIGSLYSKTTAKCFFNNATPSSLYSSLKVAIMNGMNNLFLTGQTKKGSTSLSNLLHVLTLTTYEHEKVKLGIGANFSLLLLGKNGCFLDMTMEESLFRRHAFVCRLGLRNVLVLLLFLSIVSSVHVIPMVATDTSSLLLGILSREDLIPCLKNVFSIY